MKVRLPLVTLLLGALNISLAMAVVWQLIAGSQVEEMRSVEEQGAAVITAAITPPSAPVIDGITSQAVFHKSRSFYIAPAPQIVIQPPPDYRLVGSMSFPGRPASAVLLHAQTGNRVRVAAGDALEGWTVAAVDRGLVTLQLGERTVEITSAARAQSSGLSVVSAPPEMVAAPPVRMLRVLGDAGASTPAASQRSDGSNDAPRLYRPPGNQ